jgi:sec-independent protein translocase protein TatC
MDLVTVPNIKGGSFKFRTKLFDTNNMELPFVEHIEELRQRFFQMLCLISSSILITFLNVKRIVELLEQPVSTIKFIQLSPGEYLISTIKIAFYAGLLLCISIILSQLIFLIIF